MRILRRYRFLLISVIALAGLTLAGLYESATHVGRGWLRGEAFFEGRPTSWWALRCDEWLQRIEDREALPRLTLGLPYEMQWEGHRLFVFAPDEDISKMKGGNLAWPQQTPWKRFRDSLLPQDEFERERHFDFAPKILWGAPDAVPVLEALSREEKYLAVALLAIRRVKTYREFHQGELHWNVSE